MGQGSPPTASLSAGPEKIAAQPGVYPSPPKTAAALSKKNFLVVEDKGVMASGQHAGIGGAKSGSPMPVPFTMSHLTPESTGSVSGPTMTPVTGVGGSVSQAAQAPAAAPITSTLAPVLAQRAVETVLNVVDAQQVSAGQGGMVKLDFNFGGQALAVHVQMRGGEVHTEFRTNSPELRSALSSEWKAAAGQRDPEGVRLVEPVFSSGENGSSTANGFGDAQSFSFQQQNSRQQTPAQSEAGFVRSPLAVVPAPDDAGENEAIPQQSMANRTSLHLAAVA